MLRNKYIITFVVLLSLLLSACQPIQPSTGAPQRTVQGDLYFMVPEWGDIAISIHVDVHEINPTTHAARGPVNWSIYSFTPQEGGNWRILETQAKYAIFGAEIPGAEPDTVVLITQITAKRGWGQGKPGEYAYFWLKDSGQPDGKGDQWGDIVYKLDPWTEFFPENDPPSVANYITVEQLKQSSANLPITIEMGDVQIQPPAQTTVGGVVYEIQPTGDPAKDVANIQAAIDAAKDGDTILLKAGTFNFGNWQTNPIPGGFIMITKGVTVKGDGFDADGNPKTIIQGGGYRNKQHWDTGEHGVITFGGDGKGGVLADVWLKEPHFYGVFISGFVGQNHENITVRHVKVTDISNDIPEWDQTTAIGRPIDLGANIPEWDNRGPSGTVTIEDCDISNMGSTLDMSFLDPDTGTPYYTDAEGKALLAYGQQGTHGIGLWINMSANFVVRHNTIRSQHEGLVLEYMSGSGDILVADNDIVVENISLPPHLLRGIRVTTTDGEGFPFVSTRTARIENNYIRVVGSGDAEASEVGMLLSNDNGLPGFGATYVVTGNEIEIENGNAGLVLGSSLPIAILNGAEISNNRISGTARYGVLSLDGAQNCTITDNDMNALTPSVAHVGLYGEHTQFNTVTGVTGVYEEAEGAHDNTVTGYTAK